MITFPNAKINLGLDVVEKRPDGYHNLETLFYPIPLHDVLEITKSDEEETTFTMYNAEFDGSDSDNLVVKAYNILAEKHVMPKVKMSLYKNIPTGAGMGGGSADAAFALKMLNEIAALNLTDEELEEYAARLGADCAFFIKNRPAYATGIGNILTPVDCDLSMYYIAVVKPDIHISTKEAYSLVVPCYPDNALSEIITKPVEEWKGLMKNDFEKSVFAKYPTVKEIKEKLYGMGALYASMSGSGSAFFGIFEKELTTAELKREFPDMFCECKRL
ncbi:MAG TPA: 4-(cytidine 5'-diphospho)-2-C-methyl-D-erythritol kinase [Methanocorpusculum sp.]|jgi:4-diphosphocytidyl-2-C-methyl-D-erythritol kinase|nr:4-(cytidine 5'-diphospho)-2-C-methyl-D-erythritol kinase [Methanocorpusculum sp.]